jgi:hypothetical protein
MMAELYIGFMWVTALALMISEPERGAVRIFFLSVCWPLWVLVMVQESIECVL